MSTSSKQLKTRSRAADDATADCSTTMKSMKPSWRPVDDEPKAFHLVTGLLARALEVKREAGKGVASARKAMAAGRKASSLQICHSFTLLDFVAVILQDWLIEEVHKDVAGISNGGLVTLP